MTLPDHYPALVLTSPTGDKCKIFANGHVEGKIDGGTVLVNNIPLMLTRAYMDGILEEAGSANG